MPVASSNLYKTVPEGRYMPFYDGEKTNPKKVADFLSFSNDDVAKIAGISKSSVRFTGMRVPQSIVERFKEIANICEIVADNFNGDVEKASLWLKIDNPMLGGISPRNMIRFGRYNKLKKFIFSAMEGNLP